MKVAPDQWAAAHSHSGDSTRGCRWGDRAEPVINCLDQRVEGPSGRAMTAGSSNRCSMGFGCHGRMVGNGPANAPITWSATRATAMTGAGGCCGGAASGPPAHDPRALQGHLPAPQRGRARHQPAQPVPGDRHPVRQARGELSRDGRHRQHPDLARIMIRQTGPSRARRQSSARACLPSHC